MSNKEKETAEYFCSWNPDAYIGGGTKTVSADFFTADEGYNRADIEDIRALAPGQALILDNDNHVIIRTK